MVCSPHLVIVSLTWPIPKDGKKLLVIGQLHRGELTRYDGRSGQFSLFFGFVVRCVKKWLDIHHGWNSIKNRGRRTTKQKVLNACCCSLEKCSLLLPFVTY